MKLKPLRFSFGIGESEMELTLFSGEPCRDPSILLRTAPKVKGTKGHGSTIMAAGGIFYRDLLYSGYLDVLILRVR